MTTVLHVGSLQDDLIRPLVSYFCYGGYIHFVSVKRNCKTEHQLINHA